MRVRDWNEPLYRRKLQSRSQSYFRRPAGLRKLLRTRTDPIYICLDLCFAEEDIETAVFC